MPPSKPLLSNNFPLETLRHDACEQCLTLELKNAWNEFPDVLDQSFSEDIMTDMVPKTVARVLGYALRLAPNTSGSDGLAREILGCKLQPEDSNCNPELLANLAYLYVFGMIRVFRNPKGPTPCISAEQSPRHSLEEAVQQGSSLLTPSQVTPATLRKSVLHRDRGLCVFTGVMEFDVYKDVKNTLNGPPPQMQKTQTAHIISQPLNSNIGGLTQKARAKFQWASTAAAVIQRFGGFSAHEILGGDSLHCAANAITSTYTAHHWFDTLSIWLVPATDNHGFHIDNIYNVQATAPEMLYFVNHTVSFAQSRTDDGTIVPPPSPQLLALHATCAQVAHLSGAAEHLDDIFGDPDDDFAVHGLVMTQPEATAILTQKLKALRVASSAA